MDEMVQGGNSFLLGWLRSMLAIFGQRQAERSAHLSANHSPPVIVRLQGIHVAGWLVPPLPAPSCSSGGERHLLCI